ncbi:MAG: dephospho-CoA kinase [Coriobacteriia bacterium]
MVVIVLTGGIGSGKSVAAEYFSGRGAFAIDLDDVASRLMGPGSVLLAAVAAEFGPHILYPDGSLDRAALARASFGDADAARRLDEIVHPPVAREAVTILDELRGLPVVPDVVVLEVPLLAEAPGLAELGDLVLAITAPEAMRVERAVARGMERADVLGRVLVQAPDSARVALADVVIENDGSLVRYTESLGRFWDEQLGAPRE